MDCLNPKLTEYMCPYCSSFIYLTQVWYKLKNMPTYNNIYNFICKTKQWNITLKSHLLALWRISGMLVNIRSIRNFYFFFKV